MHLVENFALAAGLKISKPYIDPLFFPTPAEKYITLHSSSGMKSKNYSHYQDIINTILPALQDAGINIIQIGESHDKHIQGTISLLGKTNLRQTFYVLSKSMLHLSNDSFSSHVCGYFKVPLVTLFGPSYYKTCEPFWKGKYKFFSPDYSNTKPSYASDEVIKKVDSIFPDEVAYHVLKMFFGEEKIKKIEPIHLGTSYSQTVIDVVPNFNKLTKFSIEDNTILSIRQDYTKEDKYLEKWISNYECAIYINRIVNISLLKKYKSNIKKIMVNLNESIPDDHISELQSTGIKMSITYTGSESINDVRLRLFPINIYEDTYNKKKDLDKPSLLCDNSYFKSSLLLVSNNKTYSSKASLDLNIEKSNLESVIDSEDFYKELEFFKIYNYASD